MSYATCNGAAVLEAALTVPLLGAWHGALLVDAASAPSGSVDLRLGSSRWRGFARRAGVWGGVASVRVVGGAGGLSAEVDPQGFRSTQLGAVLKHILRPGGEQLSSSVDAALLSRQLQWWSVLGGLAGVALAAVADAQALSWRVLADGSVWVGEESWPGASVDGDLLGVDASSGVASLYLPEPTLLPGTMLAGRQVGRVDYLVTSDRIRAIASLEH